jgi:hypothetical protein
MNCMMSPHVTWSFWNMTSFDIELKAFTTSNWKNNLVGVKVQGALDDVNYYFITTFSCNSKFVWRKMFCKKFCRIEGIKRDLWINTMFPPLQWAELYLKAWSWLRIGLFQGYVQFGVECDPMQYDNKIWTTKGIHLLNLQGENNPQTI